MVLHRVNKLPAVAPFSALGTDKGGLVLRKRSIIELKGTYSHGNGLISHSYAFAQSAFSAAVMCVWWIL